MLSIKERIIEAFLFLCSLLTIIITLGIVLVLASESVQFFSHVSIVEFVTETEWTPLYASKKFGILPLVTGTLLVTAIAIAVALPLGLTIAVYLNEYANQKFKLRW